MTSNYVSTFKESDQYNLSEHMEVTLLIHVLNAFDFGKVFRTRVAIDPCQ